MKGIYIITILNTLFVTSLFAQELNDENKKKLIDAVSLMDMKQLEDSKKILIEILTVCPNDYTTNYELAYNYYQIGEYKAAIKQLNEIRDHEEVNDLYFQMLGNCYDVLGNSKKAIAIYQNGLYRFPKSGRLYLEWGTALYLSGEYENAIRQYEKGVEEDPMFSSNYYALTKLFCGSDEKVWGMIYGELFLNLERDTERTIEISKLLYDTYVENISLDADTVSVSFSKIGNNIYYDGKSVIAPFGGVYEANILIASMAYGDSTLNLDALNNIRKYFLTAFYKEGTKIPYFDNVLFEYQKQVLESGHADAYNHWILFGGESGNTWAYDNEEEWNAFIDWFAENPLNLNDNHKFYRRQYVFKTDMSTD